MSLTRIVGCVKWFNEKSGYGFITTLEGDSKDKDIFVHYSGIKVSKSEFRYLVKGEYVEFELGKGTKHEFQGENVTGIKGGSLLCENEYRNKTITSAKKGQDARKKNA